MGNFGTKLVLCWTTSRCPANLSAYQSLTVQGLNIQNTKPRQQVLFSFQDDLNIDKGNVFLTPLFKILSSLEEDNKADSLFLYTGPEKTEIIYWKKGGLISVNSSCVNLFNGDLIKMSNSYVVGDSKPIA